MSKPGRIEFKAFDGNFGHLSSFMNSVWDQSFGASHIDFSENYLSLVLRSPHFIADNHLGCYRGSELIGFIASIPRTIIYHGKHLAALELTMLTVSTEFTGYFVIHFDALWKTFISWFEEKRAKYDALFGFAPKKLTSIYSRAAKGFFGRVPYVKKFTTANLYLDKSAMEPEEGWPPLEFFQEEDLEQCCGMLNALASEVTLGIYWDREVLRHFLSYPEMTFTYLFKEHGEVMAFVNLLLADMKGKRSRPYAFVINLHIAKLSHEEQVKFLLQLGRKAKELGAEHIVIYNSTYLPPETLARAGFRGIGPNFIFNFLCLAENLPEIPPNSIDGCMLPIF